MYWTRSFLNLNHVSLAPQVINLGAKLTLTVDEDTVGMYHCRAAVTGFPEVSS